MTTTTQAPATVPGSRPHADGAGAFVPVQTRSDRPRSYDPADFDTPTGREVNWKHTPVARLTPLFDAEAGDSDAVTVRISDAAAAPLGRTDSPRGSVFEPEDLSAAIAWTRATQADHIVIDGERTEPVLVEVEGTAKDTVAHSHLVIEARPNSCGTVILRHSGEVNLAQNVEIIVGDGAKLLVVSLQRWGDAAVHAASHQARVERDALLTHVIVTLSGAVVRVNPSVELAGPGSEAKLWGLSFADAGEHFESQVFLHHKGPHTTGDVLYKGALQGASARSVWVGDVLIGPDAVGTNTYEANRNLVLTDGARADSIPNLEIETGDIQGAGHASATGRFDDEQLFYLQARGISEDEARRLVVRGFLSDIVQRIGIPSLEEELNAAIEAELAQGEQS